MEFNNDNDIINSLEGSLVKIKTSTGYEMLDYYEISNDSLFMLGNRCTVEIKNVETIQWIDDHGGFYEDGGYFAFIESNAEH